MPKWNDFLVDVILDQLIEQGGLIDLGMVQDQLMIECPGDYRLAWKSQTLSRVNMSIETILNDVSIEFENQSHKIEWLLKWG